MARAVKKKMIIGEIIRKFAVVIGFLGEVRARNEMVNNDTIHLAEVGVDPDVLINNTAYPIGVANYSDNDVTISLDKLETTNTVISDDELYASAYNKINATTDAHAAKLREVAGRKALHSFAPASDSEKTPIVQASGEGDGESNERKKITRADLVRIKRRLDEQNVPEDGRIGVLSPKHAEQIAMWDENFSRQYISWETGKPLNFLGFKIYISVLCPTYASDFSKKNYGTDAAPADDCHASVFFSTHRVIKAEGSTKMYFHAAETDPKNRANTIGFRQYFMALPTKQEGLGAIVSGPTT